MNDRLKQIRMNFNKTQEEFASSINIKSKAHISSLESGKRAITDRIIKDVCDQYNVNEEWLRNGTGQMFVEKDYFSLDEYLKKNNATDLEIDIVKAFVKGYLKLPKEYRDEFLNELIYAFKNNILPNLDKEEPIITHNS